MTVTCIFASLPLITLFRYKILSSNIVYVVMVTRLLDSLIPLSKRNIHFKIQYIIRYKMNTKIYQDGEFAYFISIFIKKYISWNVSLPNSIKNSISVKEIMWKYNLCCHGNHLCYIFHIPNAEKNYILNLISDMAENAQKNILYHEISLF